jgi:hypothetical protein
MYSTNGSWDLDKLRTQILQQAIQYGAAAMAREVPGPDDKNRNTSTAPTRQKCTMLYSGPYYSPRGLMMAILLLLVTVVAHHHARLDPNISTSSIISTSCHGAMVAWLREQATSKDPETRHSALHLLWVHGNGYAYKDAYENIVGHVSITTISSAVATNSTSRRKQPSSPREKHAVQTYLRSLQSQPGYRDCNDGPAMRAALVPIARAREEWFHTLGWPVDATANPCDGDRFVWTDGGRCDNGRVTQLDLGGKFVLPGYTLQSPVGNLSKLDTL